MLVQRAHVTLRHTIPFYIYTPGLKEGDSELSFLFKNTTVWRRSKVKSRRLFQSLPGYESGGVLVLRFW